MSAAKQKLVIDTDCGIDDAIALLLALSSKDIAEVLAITCCFGNTTLDNVCSNIKRVLTVCDEKKIPIHRGSPGPLIKHNGPETVHGSDGLGDCADKYSTGDIEESTIPAAVALINLAKKYPTEITVLAIGPLTNIALAHRIDPDFTSNLKSIVIMGGNYKGIGNVTPVAEFNFYCDPEAANIVVSEARCNVVMVPWETTMDYGIQWELYKELVETSTSKGKFFKDVTRLHYELHTEEYDAYIDCDFLPAAVALYPHCVDTSEDFFLAVESTGEMTKGLTILLREPTDTTDRRKTQVIKTMNYEFLNMLRKKMLQNPAK